MTAQFSPVAADRAERRKDSLVGGDHQVGWSGPAVAGNGAAPWSSQPAWWRWLGRGLCVSGVAMIPWLFVLGSQLSDSTVTGNWSIAWVGLDALEALGLMTAGVLLGRGDGRACLAAAVTATLLLIDVWFDVTTAMTKVDRAVALTMAAVAELPLSALCAVLAVRLCRGVHRPHSTSSRPEQTQP